jgi:HAD superfamily hydrolase (TIGR01509 family)
MLPRRVGAVIFDMDGLLVDSESLVRDALLHTALKYGRELPMEVFLSMVGMAGPASRQIAIDHFGPDFPAEAYFTAAWTYSRELHETRGAPLKPGVAELLDHLEATDLPRAVATSSAHEIVDLQLGRHGIKDRFQTIVAAGDYPRGKPHPDPYLTAAARLGVDPTHCLALEDSHNGVRAAAAAGMMTVMVPDLLDATDEMRGLCVAIAPSLHAVLAMLAATPASAG